MITYSRLQQLAKENNFFVYYLPKIYKIFAISKNKAFTYDYLFKKILETENNKKFSTELYRFYNNKKIYCENEIIISVYCPNGDELKLKFRIEQDTQLETYLLTEDLNILNSYYISDHREYKEKIVKPWFHWGKYEWIEVKDEEVEIDLNCVAYIENDYEDKKAKNRKLPIIEFKPSGNYNGFGNGSFSTYREFEYYCDGG